MSRILFVTYHHWETKREGGFHRLAEAMCEEGHDVGFFTFPRPWWLLCLGGERANISLYARLLRGCVYRVGRGRLFNFIAPTLGLPNRMAKHLPLSVNLFLDTSSIPGMIKSCVTHFALPDVVVLESTECIHMFDKLKAAFPRARFVYRPSDPLAARFSWTEHAEVEKKVLSGCEKVFLVNLLGKRYYESALGVNMDRPGVEILPNGVDLGAYRQKWERPCEYPAGRKIVLYVGAWPPDWSVVLDTAAELTEALFVVICPELPAKSTRRRLRMSRNVIYIAGVARTEVPKYVLACDVIFIPYPDGIRKQWAYLGLTSKIIQSMVAEKPIVIWNAGDNLSGYGLLLPDKRPEIVSCLRGAIGMGNIKYVLNYDQFDWKCIKKQFKQSIAELH